MNKKNVRNMVLTGFLAALAFVLTLIPVPNVAGFLKPEISDVPAIIAAFAINPLAGLFVKLIQNMVDALVKPVGNMVIGQIANFAIGCALVLPLSLICKKWKNYILGGVVGVIAMTIVGVAGNLFMFFPVYGIPQEQRWGLITGAIIPFNVAKGAAECVLGFVLIKALAPVFKARNIKPW